MKPHVSCIIVLVTVFVLTACGPAQVPATPTLAPTHTATTSPSPTATDTPTSTPTATATPLPTSTPTPTPNPTHTPTFTPTEPPPTIAPPAGMLAEFEFGGLTLQVTKAFLAPTCAQAAVKAGGKGDMTGPIAKGYNCLVLLVNIPGVTNFEKSVQVMVKLQGSTLVDQDGGTLPQEPYMGGAMPSGSKLLQMRVYFVVKPTGKTFTWILPDGQEITIVPTR